MQKKFIAKFLDNYFTTILFYLKLSKNFSTKNQEGLKIKH